MFDGELFEKVYDRMSWFAGGYAYGMYGEANMAWLKDQSYGDLFWYGHIYRLGPAAAFDKPKIMTDEIRAKLVQFLDDTDGVEDYPLIDDSYYSDLFLNAQDKWFNDFAEFHKLDNDVLVGYFRDNEIDFEEEGGGVYPVIENESLLANDIRRASQTWDAHYKSGEFHDDTVCSYCADVEEFEQSKKVEV